MWKKWNDADVSVAFSAQKPPFYAVLLRFASALAKVNVQQEKEDKEGKKEIADGFPVHLELPVHPKVLQFCRSVFWRAASAMSPVSA